MTKLAIFDCDGTLVDSGATVVAALTESLAANNIPVPLASECRRVIGLSLVEAIAQLTPSLDDSDHCRLAEDYKRTFMAMRSAGQVEEPLFDGIIELLDALESDGWQMAVATGKSDRGLRHCLDANGIQCRFSSLQTADRHPSKPHPSMVQQAMDDAGVIPASTIVIGDTSFDMAMAAAAGARGIGAAWGYHESDELIAAGAFAVASHPLEVLDFTRRDVDA